jgi:hypothetical protein
MGKRTVLYRGDSRSTAFDKGDNTAAVEWLERPASDPDYPFVPGEGASSYVNSTEPRRIVVEGGWSGGPAARTGK